MKAIILTMMIGILFLIPGDVKSQILMEDSDRELIGEGDLQDSTELAQTRNLQEMNEERMADVKKERAQTRAKAKESQRVSGDAEDAAKQSRQAVRAEKRAQKSRERADRQAEKAEKARIKSDGNE